MFAGLLSAHIAAGGIAIAATHVPLAVDFTQTIALGGAAGAEQ
jgi:heme exporter protein A